MKEGGKRRRRTGRREVATDALSHRLFQTRKKKKGSKSNNAYRKKAKSPVRPKPASEPTGRGVATS